MTSPRRAGLSGISPSLSRSYGSLSNMGNATFGSLSGSNSGGGGESIYGSTARKELRALSSNLNQSYQLCQLGDSKSSVILSLLNQVLQMQSGHTRLDEATSQLIANHDLARRQVQELLSENEALRSQVAVAERGEVTAQQLLRSTQDDAARDRMIHLRQIDELKARVMQLQSLADTQQDSKTRLLSELDTSSNHNAVLQSSLSKLATETTERDSTIRILEARLAEADKARGSLLLDLTIANRELDACKKQIQDLEHQTINLDTQVRILGPKRHEAAVLGVRSQALESELTQAKEQIEAGKIRYQEQQAMIHQLQGEVERLRSQNASIGSMEFLSNEELQKSRREIRRLEDENRLLRVERDNLRVDLSNERDEKRVISRSRDELMTRSFRSTTPEPAFGSGGLGSMSSVSPLRSGRISGLDVTRARPSSSSFFSAAPLSPSRYRPDYL